MPAKSKAQQRLMGMAYAYRKGELKLKDLPEGVRDEVKSIAKSMTLKDLKKYASTPRKNLPEKLSEGANMNKEPIKLIEHTTFSEMLILAEATDPKFFAKWIQRLLPNTKRNFFSPKSKVKIQPMADGYKIVLKQADDEKRNLAVQVPPSVFDNIVDFIKKYSNVVEWG